VLRMRSGPYSSNMSATSPFSLQGKTGLATSRLTYALKMDPSNFNARFALAPLESEAGDYAASTEMAKLLMEKLDHSEDGLVLLASNYLAQDDRSMASSLVSDWFALDHPDTAASLSFAQIFANRRGSFRRPEEAAQILQSLTDHYPDHPPAFLALGKILWVSASIPTPGLLWKD
jgi:hypothetical protein